MGETDKSTRLLSTFLKFYKFTSGRVSSWKDFWKTFMANSPKPSPSLTEFMEFHTATLSQALNAVGRDHPLTKKFVVSLPLRLSKTILSFPTTPEMMRELMSD